MASMTARTCALIFFILSLQTVNGQGSRNKETKTVSSPRPLISEVEIMLGPSLVYVHGADHYKGSRDLKIRFTTGVGMKHQFNENLALALILSYEQKGSKTTTYSSNADYTPPAMQKHIVDVGYNYLTAKLLPTYDFSPKQRFSFGLGAYAGYLLSVKHSQDLYLNGSLIARSGARPDPSEANELYDFGISLMAAYRFPILKRNGHLQIVYNYGLMDFSKAMFVEVRNTSLSLLLGITIKRRSFLKL